jgi:hypothetical protein
LKKNYNKHVCVAHGKSSRNSGDNIGGGLELGLLCHNYSCREIDTVNFSIMTSHSLEEVRSGFASWDDDDFPNTIVDVMFVLEHELLQMKTMHYQ